MPAQSLFDRFLAHLASVDARNNGDAESRTVTVYEDPGSTAHQSFVLPDDALEARVRELGIDAHQVWPESDPETAAFRLLSIHMMETVATTRADRRRWTLTHSGHDPFV